MAQYSHSDRPDGDSDDMGQKSGKGTNLLSRLIGRNDD